MSRAAGLAGALALTALLATAGIAGAATAQSVRAIQATGEIPEAELLDVAIRVFNPGLGQADPAALEEEGIFADVRRSEAIYFAVRLMDTMQSTAQWGAVRVVPPGAETAELVVSGTILESTGKDLALEIQARDASGREWLDRKYEQEADPRGYDNAVESVHPGPFQVLYNRVANDLLAARGKLKTEELRTLRTIAELRFASDLAPDAFTGYLETNRRGRWVPARLPSVDDPMLQRVAAIRERDDLLVDTLTEHYAEFQIGMVESYDSWRALSYEEQIALEQLRRKARKMKWLGALSVLGGVIAASEGEGTVADVAIIGGIAAIQAGIGRSQEAKIHREALQELAASFDAEVDPMLVDVEGQTLRLTGSAETQYATWRELLRQIFVTETGLPVNPDASVAVPAEGPRTDASES